MKNKKKINIKQALKDFWEDVKIWRVMYLVLASIDLLLCAVLLIGSFGNKHNDQNESKEIESAQVSDNINVEPLRAITLENGWLKINKVDMTEDLYDFLYEQCETYLNEYGANSFILEDACRLSDGSSSDMWPNTLYAYPGSQVITCNNYQDAYIHYDASLYGWTWYRQGYNYEIQYLMIQDQTSTPNVHNFVMALANYEEPSDEPGEPEEPSVPDGYTLYDVDFAFSENFNPFGYLGGQSNGYFALPYGSITATNGGQLVIFDGLFFYQGEEYNIIKMFYISGQSVRYGDSLTDNQISSNVANAITYIMCEFQKTDGTGFAVNYRTFLVGDTSSVMTSNQHWILNQMRYIHIVYAKDGLNNSNYNAIDYLSLGNNGYYQDNSVPGFTGGTDVFALIGSAFASLVSLMNISILPGLTIGVLAIIPFVISVVLLVVWLFKR